MIKYVHKQRAQHKSEIGVFQTFSSTVLHSDGSSGQFTATLAAVPGCKRRDLFPC